MNIPLIFAMVLKSTVYGSVVGIIIFILKSTILKKLSARWQYYLWSVMILKLIFPSGPESEVSVFNKIELPVAVDGGNYALLGQNTETAIHNQVNLSDVFAYIWLGGFIAALLWMVVSFCIMNYKIRASACSATGKTMCLLRDCKEKTGVKRKIRVIVQTHVPTTALSGIINPKILITPDFEKMEESYIENSFIHELSHYKRKDVALNFLLLFLRCIHWFNPVLWYMFSKIRRDTELATDEKTMLYLAPCEHYDYGMILINSLSHQSRATPNLLGMANNKKDIKMRIKAISKFKKPGFIQHLSGFLTVSLISFVCLTSAVIAEPISDIIYQNIPGTTSLQVKNSTYVLSPVIEKTAEDKPESGNIENTPNVSAEISEVQNPLPDLSNKAKHIYYNSDSTAFYTFNTKPDSAGQLKFFVNKNSEYDHQIAVDISSIKTPGRGWSYIMYSSSASPFIADGLNPDTEYIVTVNTYCPGYYGIEGEITIY